MESKTCFSKDFLNTKYLIKKGDFLFSRANTIELIGACVVVNNINKILMLSDKILRFTFSKDVSKEFALYYLRSRKGRKQIEMLSTGNQDSMRNIGQEKIRQIEFPFCPIEEQHNIVQEIESRLSVADKMEESITQSLQQAEALRQSILKKAFEGKLI
jgi:type I restriction enzyme S subunit